MPIRRGSKKSTARILRVAEEIHKALAKEISAEMRDSPLGLLTITSVDISPDLKSAKIFVTQLSDDSKVRDSTISTLQEKAGYFRSCIAKEVRLRVTPRLEFVFDESIQRGAHLLNLINGVASADLE